MSDGVFWIPRAQASGLLQKWFPDKRSVRPFALGGSITAASRSVIWTLHHPKSQFCCLKESIMMFVGLISVNYVSTRVTMLLAVREGLTGVDDVLVVQISEASKSIPYDDLFGDGRKSCGVDMEQSLLEIGEDEHMPLRNAIHGCSDMGRVLDVLL